MWMGDVARKTWIRGLRAPFQRLPCAVDVVLVAAGERGDLHVGDGVGDGMNGFKVAHAGGRETGFDDVHAEAFQLTRHTELFLEVHGSAGGLLAIAGASCRK